MADLEFSIVCAAPPNEVFVFFVPQRMTYWYGAEMQCRFELLDSASEFSAGQKIRVSGILGRRAVSHTVVVTRYEWGRILEWQFQDSYGLRGTQRWEVESLSRGTLVRMCDAYEPPGRIGKILDWLLTRHAVARRDRVWLTRLQRLVERN